MPLHGLDALHALTVHILIMPKRAAAPKKPSRAEATAQLAIDLADIIERYNGSLWRIAEAEEITAIAQAAAPAVSAAIAIARLRK